MKIKSLCVKSFIQLPDSLSIQEISSRITDSGKDYVIVFSKTGITGVHNAPSLLKQAGAYKNSALLGEIDGEKSFQVISENTPVFDLIGTRAELVVVVDSDGLPVGIIDNVKAVRNLWEFLWDTNQKIKDELVEYQRIIEHLEEEIFVTDGNGFILFLNPEGEKVCGVKLEDVKGRHVSELEKAKIFSTSTSLEVLRTKRKANILQKLKSGKTVLGTGVPIYDESGALIRILSTTKDVREINNLMEEIKRKNLELKTKNQELHMLREGIFAQDNFVCRSPKMMDIKNTIVKIAPTDISVLIQGESGVGKEVVAKLIHNLSSRNKHPLIKINCGLIPENLLESELFGYAGGAFTGANKGGKIGKVELAHQGTLFLDEIGEMPLNLQVKLLEFLQDREITRVGSTSKIKIDTRVIVATNRDLQAMVNEGRFRQDLFYRLNVLPVTIPPLRERMEDIPVLAEYFLDVFNSKYQTDKKFDSEVINAFGKYDWPGNVRELLHFVERLVVTTEADTITCKKLPEFFSPQASTAGKVICTDLIPLKKAKKEVEKQLVTRAYEIYQSTYKAGEVLEIDQSTVVKLLKKYK